MKINFNPLTELRELYIITKAQKAVFNSVLGISWFWFFGSGFLTVLPNLVNFTIKADSSVITLFLAVFTISIAIGSVLCEKLSHTTVEIGLVPFGAFLISIFAFDMALIDAGSLADTQHSFSSLIKTRTGLNMLVDLFGIGLAGSFFIVPLYALIQHRSPKETCSRVIAGNNIANALFMVLAAVSVSLLYSFDFSSLDVILVLAVLNLVVSVYIFTVVPEFFMRFCIWLLAKTVYSLHYKGREHIPQTGSAMLLANHVSFIDWFILAAACQRPLRFVMHYKFFYIPGLNFLFRMVGAIPIAQEKENPEIKKRALESIHRALADGDMVCIFPEGMITHDGQVNKFRPGFENILKDQPVPVIPVAIKGLWGSFFSRKGGKAIKKVPKPTRRSIDVLIGQPLPANQASCEIVQKLIENQLTAA